MTVSLTIDRAFGVIRLNARIYWPVWCLCVLKVEEMVITLKAGPEAINPFDTFNQHSGLKPSCDSVAA